MGAAEPASFDTVGEIIRTNHYETVSAIIMSTLVARYVTLAGIVNPLGFDHQHVARWN
jgi:methylmalonyl-CoA mutase cobalamin-binding subunit